MIPVYQKIEHDPGNGAWGDCHRAALASVLELPLESVPHFNEGAPADWRVAERAWLAKRDLEPMLFAVAGDLERALHQAAAIVPAGFYLLSGTSSVDGLNHTVVARGDRVVHDPDPDALKGKPALSGPIPELGQFVGCYLAPIGKTPGMRRHQPSPPSMREPVASTPSMRRVADAA